jgi:hypothetical protein
MTSSEQAIKHPAVVHLAKARCLQAAVPTTQEHMRLAVDEPHIDDGTELGGLSSFHHTIWHSPARAPEPLCINQLPVEAHLP